MLFIVLFSVVTTFSYFQTTFLVISSKVFIIFTPNFSTKIRKIMTTFSNFQVTFLLISPEVFRIFTSNSTTKVTKNMTKILVPKSEWVLKKIGGWCCGSCQAPLIILQIVFILLNVMAECLLSMMCPYFGRQCKLESE